MPDAQIRTLVAYVQYSARASYYDDWKDAFAAAPQFNCTFVNIFTPVGRWQLRRTVRDHDLIVLLHSTNADNLSYLQRCSSALQVRRGKLLTFVGNEVNVPGSSMADKLVLLRTLAPDLIATQLLLEAGRWLFADCTSARVIALPHALNPQAFRPIVPHQDRTIDLGTRTFRYPVYLGDDERNRLLNFFLQNAGRMGLSVDINTEQRFERSGWSRFLNRCRGTLSTEAGSFYLERDDATVTAIRHYLTQHRGRRPKLLIPVDSPLRRIFNMIPWSVKTVARRFVRNSLIGHEMVLDEEVRFADIYDQFFKAAQRAPVYSKAISSRHFDAIGTKTCQLMFPGRYNDILVADKHYLAVASDFSNISDVIGRFRDQSFVRRMVDETYEFVMSHHTYGNRMSKLAFELGLG